MRVTTFDFEGRPGIVRYFLAYEPDKERAIEMVRKRVPVYEGEVAEAVTEVTANELLGQRMRPGDVRQRGNQEQANGVECCYFVAGDKPDQLLHDGSPLIGQFSHVRFPNDTSRLKAQLSGRMNAAWPVTEPFSANQHRWARDLSCNKNPRCFRCRPSALVGQNELIA